MIYTTMNAQIKTTNRVLVSERTAKVIEIEAKLTALSVEVVGIINELYPGHEEKVEYYMNSWGEALDCVRMLRDRSITMAIEDIGLVNNSNKQMII